MKVAEFRAALESARVDAHAKVDLQFDRSVAELIDYVHNSIKEVEALVGGVEALGGVVSGIVKGVGSLKFDGIKPTFDFGEAKTEYANFQKSLGLGSNAKVFSDTGKNSAHYFLNSFNETLQLAKVAGINQSPAESARLNRKPELKAGGPSKDTSGKDLKASLDAQLKIIKDGEKAQADAYQFANSYLQGVYQDGLISQGDYFAAQKQLRDANLANIVQALDAEIALNQKTLGSKSSNSTDRIKASGAIALAEQQRAEAITKAGAADILATQNEAREVERLSVTYDNLKASIAAATGDEVGAQQIKNAQTLKQAALVIQSIDGDPAVLGRLEKQIDLQTQRTAQQKAYAELLDDTQRKEAEIYLDAEAGGKSELETLAAIRDARTLAISQLQAQADAAQKLANTEGSTDADKKRAADLALSVKKAKSEIDPLAKAINQSLEDSFSSSFVEFINGTKSASQAFRDFAKSVESDLASLASKELAKTIFGTGAGGALSSFFDYLKYGTTEVTGGVHGTAPDVSNVDFNAATGTNLVERDSIFQLHKGEAVVPKAFNPAAGGMGAATTNNVFNYGNDKVETKTNDTGGVDVIIKAAAKLGAQMTTADFARGTGPSAQAAKARFRLGAGSLPKRG